MNERDKCSAKYRNTKREVDISSYKRKRNEVNIPLRKAKSAYFKNLLNENKKLPREFWKTLKKFYPVKSRDSVKTSIYRIKDYNRIITDYNRIKETPFSFE